VTSADEDLRIAGMAPVSRRARLAVRTASSSAAVAAPRSDPIGSA
jgi:hypothetical protein